MSLGELRIFHASGHVGFIWSCKYCAQRYAELMEQRADEQRQSAG
jgi:hypothetical protein